MNSDESDELPDWVDSWSDDGGASTTPDADYGHQREYMLNSSQIHEFELDHAERRWHRPCPGCGRLPLGDQSPKEVYNSQQRERWDRFGCLACYAIWQCSLAVKRDVVRVSGDVIWFSDIEADSGLKIRLFNEVGKTDDIVHQFGFARHVAPRADSDEALKCARDWLASCMQTHPSCRSERGIYSVPTRLLDVSLSNPRLVHSGSLPIDSYAALSHCWGPIQPLRTLHNNVESHAKGMSLASLPKTFQDAVRVTRYLDLRYLWIDSLCIIQDDDEDWSREAAKMAAYYSGAQVVISASSSDGSSEGFLGPRKESIKGTLVIGVGGDVAGRIPPLHFRESDLGMQLGMPLRKLGYV
ncbi:hypothetical protein NUW58_g8556 [Xylaria curta]|uniref:Uncharacterized protein n=1 Tax=Xylaria curta TaxID=42375 RepID=A0ACC1N636_9PEZI|nr:hypothetical protein NUW58_g8556 [Xylaria curta]